MGFVACAVGAALIWNGMRSSRTQTTWFAERIATWFDQRQDKWYTKLNFKGGFSRDRVRERLRWQARFDIGIGAFIVVLGVIAIVRGLDWR